MSKPDDDCYCHTCKRWFDSLGIASHRASHRRKSENCEIKYKNGQTIQHLYGARKKPKRRKR